MSATLYGQPFIEEIRAYEKTDSLHFPPKKANLFIGSSSLRLWNTMETDFTGFTVINRGFGGSSLPDVIRYAEHIIFPYRPKQILIYCGENDFASSDTVSVETVVARFTHLFELIRSRLKKVPVIFIAMKPSPSREHLMAKFEEGNRRIKEFLQTQKKTAFVDVYSLMLTPEGKPKAELFVEDMLHMNDKGYAIWQKAILPVLKK